MNVEINKDAKTIVVFIAKLILCFRTDVFLSSPLSMLFDSLLIEGIMVTARELINVAGIMTSGNVMPMIIPNSDKASVDEYP